MPNEVEEYAQGLLVEEMSEAGAMLGKAKRFGIDTPGPPSEPYCGRSAREGLTMELGDVLAAINWSCMAGLISRDDLEARAAAKLRKLLDPAQRDNLGRQLAPTLPAHL